MKKIYNSNGNYYKIYNKDCLIQMKKIKDKSIDLILCDLPYGITWLEWDKVINYKKLWKQYKRIIKDNGAIVLFSKQPFTTYLIYNNIDIFKYCLIWKKDNIDNFPQAKRRFVNITEDICVFYKSQPIYNPQGIKKYNKEVKQGRGKSVSFIQDRNESYTQEYTNYPRNILEFNRDLPNVHPTQKPIKLLEYLIKTYSNENEIVLDNTMGSGSTGVACINTKRNFIGIELSKEYYNIAKKRLEENTISLF